MLERIQIVEDKLNQIFTENHYNSRLLDAMKYSVLNAGKRLRPFLCMAWSNIVGLDQELAAEIAAIVELVHCYSLVHDDLPLMDNDDFRRGKPSCHKEFDEATALLCGNGLLTLAFQRLSHENLKLSAEKKCNLAYELSVAAGFKGMLEGQNLDINLVADKVTEELVLKIHKLKSAKLFMVSCMFPTIAAGSNNTIKGSAKEFGLKFGALYQLYDDLGDREKDRLSGNNANYSNNFGYDKTINLIEVLTADIKSILSNFGKQACEVLSLIDEMPRYYNIKELSEA